MIRLSIYNIKLALFSTIKKNIVKISEMCYNFYMCVPFNIHEEDIT